MFSIGQLSRRTGVKVPTIRYYENSGLMPAADRTAGNQRRYDETGLERLGFIKHARELGFSLDAISALIDLQNHPDRSCAEANQIAKSQLDDVRTRIAKLQSLEKELTRIADGCTGSGVTQSCYVLQSLADHELCQSAH